MMRIGAVKRSGKLSVPFMLCLNRAEYSFMKTIQALDSNSVGQSGLSVPNRTVPYIPPSIRFSSRSIVRTFPLYGTVRFILRAGYGDSVRFGSGMYG